MLRDKFLTIVTVVLLAAGLGCIGFVVLSVLNIEKHVKEVGHEECIDKSINAVAFDAHMAGLIENGGSYTVLTGFYDCNEIKREDLVWFRFSRVIEPVPRKVYGLPGDTFDANQDSADLSKWYIQINGERIKSLSGADYFIQSQSVPPLKTYALSLKGTIPEEIGRAHV